MNPVRDHDHEFQKIDKNMKSDYQPIIDTVPATLVVVDL